MNEEEKIEMHKALADLCDVEIDSTLYFVGDPQPLSWNPLENENQAAMVREALRERGLEVDIYCAPTICANREWVVTLSEYKKVDGLLSGDDVGHGRADALSAAVAEAAYAWLKAQPEV